MKANYWSQYKRGVSRRKVLTGMATLGGAAAFLAACGGDDDKSEPSSQSPSTSTGARQTGAGGANPLLSKPVDTSDQAKPGGAYRGLQTQDITTFDVLTSQASFSENLGGFVYSRLVKPIAGKLEEPTGEVEGDLARSFEVAEDGLQVTFKLRPEAKWDQREPTNSRPVDAEDILFSWNKFVKLHPFGGNLANSVSPGASIASVTAPDKSTVVVKLAFPDASILTDLSSTAYLFIEPREAESEFDPRGEARGSGAWYVDEYRPSSNVTYRKNPNWWRSDVPFMDEWQSPIISEYTAQLSQLKAGNVYTFSVRSEDILPTKHEIDDLLLAQATAWPTGFVNWQFGWQKDTVFIDDRIRKALSTALDRKLLIKEFNNVDTFAAEGLELPLRFHSPIPANLDAWWIDPFSEEIGEGGRWFQYDVEESKKLLSAAGYPDGLEVPLLYTPRYSAYEDQILVHQGMFEEAGFRPQFTVLDYQTDYLPRVADSKGKYEGMATILDVITEPAQFMKATLLPNGGNYHGFFAEGHFGGGDPEVTARVKTIRGEFDLGKQQAMGKDLAKYLATKMYYVPYAGAALGYTLSWPVIGNFGVYRLGGRLAGAPQETALYYWIDDSKAPLS